MGFSGVLTGKIQACTRQKTTPTTEARNGMADGRAGGSAGIGLGGILVIIGIVVAIVLSLGLGILIAIVGLVAFGGFARGRWY
jgi:hypothetical protein